MSITMVDVGYALLFIFPAYCANVAPVIFGGGPPIDFGKVFWDGKPLFGKNKTFRGFLAGLVVGTFVGFVQNVLFGYDILLGFMVSLGALVGDLSESFIKRRLDLPPGSSLPIADQLDFVAGALLFSLPVSPPDSLIAVLVIIIITPPIHFLMNLLANRFGVKRKK
ncbi:MAG: CDP-2,3-bis-(O-geranylgeranyl)-sn-glycerol synthase [Candidatus Bathyarchaeia archaeon]